MKKLLFMLIFLVSCGSGNSPAPENITLSGTASQFTKVQSGFTGSSTIELSMLYNSTTDRIEVFYDRDNRSHVVYAEYNSKTGVLDNYANLDTAIRFPYTIYQEGSYYTYGHIGTGDDTFDWDIHRWKHITKTTLIRDDNNSAIIPRGAYSSYQYGLWNPAVTVVNGKWTMLYDCATGSSFSLNHLCYASSSDGINWVSEENPVIYYAGSPWIGYVDGKGYIAIIQTYTVNNPWIIQAATSPDGKNWTISSKFKIEQSGVHICDPHLVETPDGLYLTFSFDQAYTILYKANMTMSELFDYL